MNIPEVAEKALSILDTIAKVEGEKYCTVIRHLANTHALFMILDPQFHEISLPIVKNLVGDLAKALGVDLNDEATLDSISKDLKALGLPV